MDHRRSMLTHLRKGLSAHPSEHQPLIYVSVPVNAAAADQKTKDFIEQAIQGEGGTWILRLY